MSGVQQPSKKRKIRARATYPDDSKISQTDVEEWYGNRCTLTGQHPGQPAPVFTYFSHVLEEWDIMAAKELLYSGKGNGKRNILPLGAHVRQAWDAHLFALRPAKHHDSENRMFLQTDFHIVRDLRTGERMEVEAGGQNTFVTGRGKTIETGSLFELVTADKDEFPLPSFDILSLAYDLHILLASMSAAGMARELFRGQHRMSNRSRLLLRAI
ncbi:hypothetical protein GE09DRAFT_1242399 [Coniochaeta sp. 2T2.1]|nr:hypothetical protein GE09DRAFT_1242399 [Coniochaeta sp. 2T2.1]